MILFNLFNKTTTTKEKPLSIPGDSREILNCGCPSVLLSQGCLVLRMFDPGFSSDAARRGGRVCAAFSVPPGIPQVLLIQIVESGLEKVFVSETRVLGNIRREQ